MRWIEHILEEMETTTTQKKKERKTKINRTVEVERKQLGYNYWKMAENAARDRMEWRKLLSGLMHQEEDKQLSK